TAASPATYPLSLHDALPIWSGPPAARTRLGRRVLSEGHARARGARRRGRLRLHRSEGGDRTEQPPARTVRPDDRARDTHGRIDRPSRSRLQGGDRGYARIAGARAGAPARASG